MLPISVPGYYGHRGSNDLEFHYLKSYLSVGWGCTRAPAAIHNFHKVQALDDIGSSCD